MGDRQIRLLPLSFDTEMRADCLDRALYEGFGLPVLEAMQCGVPVLTSNVSSLPEVAGAAALLVRPTEIDDISHELRRLLEDADLRAALRARGYQRAGIFLGALCV